jgi:hypothetical protein
MGDQPCEMEIVSDQSTNFNVDGKYSWRVNYEDPNYNVGTLLLPPSPLPSTKSSLTTSSSWWWCACFECMLLCVVHAPELLMHIDICTYVACQLFYRRVSLVHIVDRCFR